MVVRVSDIDDARAAPLRVAGELVDDPQGERVPLFALRYGVDAEDQIVAREIAAMDGKLALTLGADNLLDQYPNRVPNNRVLPTGVVNLNATNALGFSRYSPYGFNGRFLYARFGYSW